VCPGGSFVFWFPKGHDFIERYGDLQRFVFLVPLERVGVDLSLWSLSDVSLSCFSILLYLYPIIPRPDVYGPPLYLPAS